MNDSTLNGYLLEIAKEAMACRFEVLLHPGQPEHGPEVACKALDLVAHLEQLWSTYIPTSEISLINTRARENHVSVSSSTIHLLQVAKQIWEATDGGFDLTSHRLSKAWGFYRRQGRMPNSEEITAALQSIGMQYITWDEQESTVKLTHSVELNTGGIGKGLAIDMASQMLEDAGVENYAIHGGKSSIRCRGSERSPMGHRKRNGTLIDDLQTEKSEQPNLCAGWKIMVRHPEQSERVLGHLRLRNQSMGTSGPANQFFYFAGKRYGHIINPRTGWPVEGMLSLTVLHPSAGWADALATGLYVAGIDSTIRYCENNPDTAVLALLPGARQGQIEIVTCNLQPDQWIVA